MLWYYVWYCVWFFNLFFKSILYFKTIQIWRYFSIKCYINIVGETNQEVKYFRYYIIIMIETLYTSIVNIIIFLNGKKRNSRSRFGIAIINHKIPIMCEISIQMVYIYHRKNIERIKHKLNKTQANYNYKPDTIIGKLDWSEKISIGERRIRDKG